MAGRFVLDILFGGGGGLGDDGSGQYSCDDGCCGAVSGSGSSWQKKGEASKLPLICFSALMAPLLLSSWHMRMEMSRLGGAAVESRQCTMKDWSCMSSMSSGELGSKSEIWSWTTGGGSTARRSRPLEQARPARGCCRMCSQYLCFWATDGRWLVEVDEGPYLESICEDADEMGVRLSKVVELETWLSDPG